MALGKSDSVNFRFTFKSKEHYMVTKVLDFEASFGSPYWCIKVAVMTLVFKALLVRNLATIMEIEVAISSSSRNLGHSFWEMVSLDHYFVRSSMEDISVSHNPKKRKNQRALG